MKRQDPRRVLNVFFMRVDTSAMSLSRTSDGPDSAPAARPPTLAEIELALERKKSELLFPADLEAAYEAAHGKERNRSVALYLLVYMAAKLIFLLCDLSYGSHILYLALALRLGIVVPLTLLSVVLLRRSSPDWVCGVAAFTPLLAETALVMVMARLAPPAVTVHLVFAAMIGIFAQTLLMPVPFRQAAAGLAAALTTFAVLGEAHWAGRFGPPVDRDTLIFVIGFSMPALYERYKRESSHRREYLLKEANRLRMEETERANAHLQRLSSIDGLTGIFNRRYLDAALSRLCERAAHHQSWISVVMIDVDHFKSLNDTAGHQHGDFCLEQIAQTLQRSVRLGVDTVARYGGEEFVAILPDADEQEAVMIGERIRLAIEAVGLPGAQGRTVTISAGAATLRGRNGVNLTPADLIASADEALYQAKRSGRNRVVCSMHALHTV
jgi:diguanylate cyclase (GGDEF)-like protein